MRCKKRFRADSSSVCVLNYRPRDAHSVKRACSASDLVVNYKTRLSRVFKNVRDLVHLKHKRGLSRREIVRRTDTRKYLINNTDSCLICGNVRSHLRHKHDQRDLTHISGFTRHIGARSQHYSVCRRIKLCVVRHEIRVLNELLNNGMTSVLDLNYVGNIYLRFYIMVS